MPKKFQDDINLDNVARVRGALDPLLPQDYVTLAYLQALTAQYTAEDLGETSNTSQVTDATKVTLTTPALVAGDYIIEWTYKSTAAASNRRGRFNIKDGVTEIISHIDHYSDIQDYPIRTGRKKLTGISGVKTFTFNFRADTAGTTITVSEALVTLRKLP